MLPEAEEVDIQIDAKDLRIDTFCSSGPGGQSVNTTYSAVRITHIPTGLVVSQQDEKSQIKNRAKAMKVLRSRLYEMEMRKQQEAIAKDRRTQVGTGDRSEKIRTYNFKENRITDHRIGFTMHQLTSALDGDIGELIDAAVTHFTSEKLKDATDTECTLTHRALMASSRAHRRGARGARRAPASAPTTPRSTPRSSPATCSAGTAPRSSPTAAMPRRRTFDEPLRRARRAPRRARAGRLHHRAHASSGVWTSRSRPTSSSRGPRPSSSSRRRCAGRAAMPTAGAIVDVGTGSGCLAVALAREFPEAAIVATDISAAALAVARRNAARHGVDRRITFVQTDLLDGVDGTASI